MASTIRPISNEPNPVTTGGSHFRKGHKAELIDGLIEVVSDQGYERTTVAEIVKRVGVSKSTFYQHFRSKDECLVVAFEMVTSQLGNAIADACDEADNWPDEVKAGIAAMLRFLAAEPSYARFCVVEVLSSSPAAIARYEDVMIPRLTPFLEEDRVDCSAERLAALPRSIRETIAGGILWIIYQRIRLGKAAELEELEPELVEFSLAPYLGADGARGVALGAGHDAPPVGDSLERLLRNADLIRTQHRPGRDTLPAAELIREDRGR